MTFHNTRFGQYSLSFEFANNLKDAIQKVQCRHHTFVTAYDTPTGAVVTAHAHGGYEVLEKTGFNYSVLSDFTNNEIVCALLEFTPAFDFYIALVMLVRQYRNRAYSGCYVGNKQHELAEALMTLKQSAILHTRESASRAYMPWETYNILQQLLISKGREDAVVLVHSNDVSVTTQITGPETMLQWIAMHLKR